MTERRIWVMNAAIIILGWAGAPVLVAWAVG